MILFETERLVMRTLEESDAERMMAYRNKKEVAQYQSWSRFSKRDALRLIRHVQRYPFRAERYDMMQMAIELPYGEQIGDLNVTMVGTTAFTIGYTIDSIYWHQGYGREAVRGLLEYMKATYGLKKAIAYIMSDNYASKRLLIDLGFSKFDESKFFREESYSKIL